jgi:hypothetical protein
MLLNSSILRSHVLFVLLCLIEFIYCLFLIADFSNVISKQEVKILAEADDQEVVREVQVM